MSSRHLKQSEYALQQVVLLSGEVVSQLAEARFTHTYKVVFWFCDLKNIDYLVVWYLNIGAPPFEGWVEEWLLDGEISSSST